MNFFGIHLKLLDRLRNNIPVQLPSLCQCVESGDDGALGVHFEEPAETLASVAPPKPVGAKCR